MSAAIEVPDANRDAAAIVEVAIELRAVPTRLRRTTTAQLRGGLEAILAAASAPGPIVEAVDGWAMPGAGGEQLFELGEHSRLSARGLEAEKGAHALMAMSMRFSSRHARRSRASKKGKQR